MAATFEETDPAVAGRPARRLYSLTSDGAVAARRELAALHQRLTPGRAIGQPHPAGGRS